MNDDRTPPDDRARREALGVIGGLAAAPVLLAGAAHAQPQNAPLPAPAPRALRDPREAYPKPPFPPQQQPWPGLAKNMKPLPDHGERSYSGSGKLAGRKALITGGDSGIGRAAAIAFAREGADVAFGYLPQEEEDAREVVALIRAAGRKAVPLPGDIRDEAFCRKLVDDAVRGLGGLDILCNNAARQHSLPSILDLTTELFDWTLKTNLYAMFWITKAAVPHLPPGSAIINTASVVAFSGPPNLLDYATTKGGIVTFTRSLSKQLVERGIRVNAIAPGPYWTPLQPSGGQPPDKLPQFGSEVPMKRPGQPVELAPLFVTLAGQDASFTTGMVWGSTGGEAAN
jgi:NAD(P)-dependent dehydrogenase (short-subunit alcohol dehydrogenase family)